MAIAELTPLPKPANSFTSKHFYCCKFYGSIMWQALSLSESPNARALPRSSNIKWMCFMFFRLHLIYSDPGRGVSENSSRAILTFMWRDVPHAASQTSSLRHDFHLFVADRHSEHRAHSNVYCLHNKYKIIINISTSVILYAFRYSVYQTTGSSTHTFARSVRQAHHAHTLALGWRAIRKQTGFIYFYHHA